MSSVKNVHNNKAISRLHWLGVAEGISYLVLLGIAMPLKYFANLPAAVSVVGMAHGVLFVAYLAGIYYCWQAFGWSFKTAFLGALGSVLPFGTFWFKWHLKQKPLA